MEKRVSMLNNFYNRIDEDIRLQKSRQGQLEYLTTMEYILKFGEKNSSIIEVGAGTGRYSIPLAKAGFNVTALELVEKNLDILREHSIGIENVKAMQGDALDLSLFNDNTFDITLVLGPMYHLYSKENHHRCLDEAIRVTKSGGYIMIAFLSAYAIINADYIYNYSNLEKGLSGNFDQNFITKHFPEQLFTGFDILEFESLFHTKNVTHITTVATDGIFEVAEKRSDFEMSDEDFQLYSNYHLAICEKRELLGNSSHLLYICKKI